MTEDWRARVADLAARAGIADVRSGAAKAAAVLAVCLVAFAVWRSSAHQADGAVFSDAPQSGSGASAQATSSVTTTATIVVVHVAGCVHHPDVYQLPAGARVIDAVKAAGGALAAARLDALNLARLLTDGEQIYVPTAAEAGAGGAAGAAQGGGGASGAVAGGKINLNTATAEQLDTLPGVGPATAKKIVDDRTANGPFASVADLQRVSGIGAKKVDSLKDLVTAP